MKRISLLLIVFLSTASMYAQGYVEEIIDPEVKTMEEERIARRKGSDGKVAGFRIMVGFYSSRSAANEKLAEAKGIFGSIYSTVLLFDEPNFKIYVGEFLSRTDADAALADIKKRYPGARIVSDRITAPRAK